MFDSSLDDCRGIAGPHMVHAYRDALDQSGHEGYRPLDSGGVLLITGGDAPLCNSAIGAVGEEVLECAQALSACGKPAMMTFCDEAIIDEETQIGEFGFVASPASPALAVKIDELPILELPDGYEYERIMPGSDSTGWADAVATVFRLPHSFCELLGPKNLPGSGAADDLIQYFQVRKGETVVATSMLLLAEGVAGIYCVATRVEHRNRALGAIVTALPLQRIQHLGYQYGVLQASPMGLPVYQKLGFQQVGAIRSYVRRAQN